MGYLSKKTILQAYEQLSHLSEDPTVQGATQKVSAIRHFMALDGFYKETGKDCNTRDKNDKNDFITHVGHICDVCPTLYTSNFYIPLKENTQDYAVGSNFYSVGQVKSSLINTSVVFEYPKRGGSPLFQIKGGVLIRNVGMYENLNSYVESTRLKVALVLWILRKTNLVGSVTKDLYNAFLNQYTPELVKIVFADNDGFEKELSKYDLSLQTTPCSIEEHDVNSLFKVDRKVNEHLPLNNVVAKKNACSEQYLIALRTKPFMLLAGISGTGKSRIVRKLAQATITDELQGCVGENFNKNRWTLHNPANFELIQVKPNWHNSMDVVGYLSNIPTPHYVFTPFVKFVVKAWQNLDVPFFLCLDEMNLAPVEEYFAEFLSAIESRSFENEEYVTDPIVKPFDSFGKEVCDAMLNALLPDIKASNATQNIVKLKDHFRTKGLTLPKNLIVIGTVNMDETTFSFSRKVLDRAMSVEMNEVDYDSFLEDTTDDDIKAIVEEFEEEKYGEGLTLNALLVDRHIEAKEVREELGDDAQFVIDYLKRVNALLEGTPFKLGYRAANEALIYLRSAQEFGQPDRIAALDNFTLMKILSRIEGDENKLKITNSDADKERLILSGVDAEQAMQFGDLNILTALRNIVVQLLGEYRKTEEDSKSEGEIPTEGETEQEEQAENAILQKVEKKQEKRLKSIKKIDNMLSQLKRDHFVSYWN